MIDCNGKPFRLVATLVDTMQRRQARCCFKEKTKQKVQKKFSYVNIHLHNIICSFHCQSKRNDDEEQEEKEDKRLPAENANRQMN